MVTYYGEDYVYIDQKKSKVYMYNKAYIIYGDMRIDAGLIILDYDKNEVMPKALTALVSIHNGQFLFKEQMK